MKRAISWLAGLALAALMVVSPFGATPARAQSTCSSIVFGAVLTAAQWNACFQGKQDYTGSTLVTFSNLTATTPITVTPGSGVITVACPTCSSSTNVPMTVGTTTIVSGTTNGLFYDNAGVLGNLATANNGVLITSAGGAPSISSTLPTAVQGNITQLGAITVGVWNGTTISTGNGGTGCNSPTAACLDNITGFSSTGIMVRTGSAAYSFESVAAGSGIAVTNGSGVAGNPTVALAGITADNVLGNASGTTAVPAGMQLPSCSGSQNALLYNTSTHAFSCNTISGSGTVNSGVAGQLAWYLASTNVVSGNANATMSAGALTLGVANTTQGQVVLEGSTSGAVTQTTLATAGTPTITWGNTSGTPAVTAGSPLAISSTTGNITCLTCATTTNGGALTGTAPVAISVAGAISITGVAGQVLAGSGPAFTATPTLGAQSVATGQLKFAGTTNGVVTLSVADSAGTWTMKLPTGTGSAGQFLETDGAGNASWANVAGSGTINSGSTGQLTWYAANGTTVSGNANANIVAGALTLGQASSTIGQLILAGSTSGTTTITPNVSAGGTLTLPAVSGTVALTSNIQNAFIPVGYGDGV